MGGEHARLGRRVPPEDFQHQRVLAAGRGAHELLCRYFHPVKMFLPKFFPDKQCEEFFITNLINFSRFCYFMRIIIMIDFSSFEKILVHLKLQTCFVLPSLLLCLIVIC